jgi:hypothetical protein
MEAITRLSLELSCPTCRRPNEILLPETACGNEFIWHARCGSCGSWRYFHSREDASFVLAIRETARRRGEGSGLSPEGTREAHAAFEATVDPCSCGGRFHVVLDLLDEPCLGCGQALRGALSGQTARHPVEVRPLRS